MRILLIGDGDIKYGASHSLIQMATALRETQNDDVTVLLNKESQVAQELRDNGCRVEIAFYAPYYQPFPSKLWKLPLKYIIRGLQYCYGRIIAIKATQHIMENCNYDIIHSNSSREDISAILSEHYHIPMVRHIRVFGDRDFKCYSYRRNYIQLMNRTSARLIAVSNSVKEHWIEKGIEEEKIITIYNGVDSICCRTRQKNLNGQIFKLIMAGSIIENKGQLQAVEAVIKANVKQDKMRIFLDIIGDGDDQYTRRIIRTIEENSMEGRIKLLGYKTNVMQLLSNYDAGVVCSKDEAFGRVTAEYMMAGLPVIASNTGANMELIREGREGLFYNYGNTDDLAEKMIKLGNSIEDYDSRLIHAYAVENYSSEVNAEQIHEVYKEIVGRQCKVEQRS